MKKLDFHPRKLNYQFERLKSILFESTIVQKARSKIGRNNFIFNIEYAKDVIRQAEEIMISVDSNPKTVLEIGPGPLALLSLTAYMKWVNVKLNSIDAFPENILSKRAIEIYRECYPALNVNSFFIEQKTGRFENNLWPENSFDLILSNRSFRF